MNDDLGLFNKPISNLFPKPQNIEEWKSYCLSEDKLLEFEENGFIQGIKVLNDDQIEVLREELSEMVVPDHEGREFFYEYFRFLNHFFVQKNFYIFFSKIIFKIRN